MESKYFDDPAVALDVFLETFTRASQDEAVLKSIETMDELVYFDLTQSDPSLAFHLDTRDGKRIAAIGNPSDARPDVTLSLSVDTAHKTWSDELNPVMAVATGKMRAKGNQITLLKLAPLLKLITPIYNQVLDDHGLSSIKL